jgi:hypothetical protein
MRCDSQASPLALTLVSLCFSREPKARVTTHNKYVFVIIDQYSKWYEVWPIKEHDAYTIVKFLEDEIICRYGIPKYILTNNGNEWMKEFDENFHNYGITH